MFADNTAFAAHSLNHKAQEITILLAYSAKAFGLKINRRQETETTNWMQNWLYECQVPRRDLEDLKSSCVV